MNKIVWNKVSKSLPKNKDTVAVICGGNLFEAWYDIDTWYSGNCKYHISAITHWAKINKPKVIEPKRVEVKKANAPMIMNGNFQEFQSPLDGTVISCHSKLRDHNKKHGVTNVADYSSGHFEKRGKEMELEARGQTPQAKRERQQLIAKTLNDFGV